MGPREKNITGAHEVLEKLADNHGCKVTLIGQSLGGIYAREFAKQYPDLVRQVICLGSPFNNHEGRTWVSHLYELFNSGPEENWSWAESQTPGLSDAPSVPFTSVFSRADGVAHWQTCIQQNGHDRCENVEVYGSHTGMCFNVAALYVVADRLCQRESNWAQFVVPRSLSWLFPFRD